jgi:hypothetical protein
MPPSACSDLDTAEPLTNLVSGCCVVARHSRAAVRKSAKSRRRSSRDRAACSRLHARPWWKAVRRAPVTTPASTPTAPISAAQT